MAQGRSRRQRSRRIASPRRLVRRLVALISEFALSGPEQLGSALGVLARAALWAMRLAAGRQPEQRTNLGLPSIAVQRVEHSESVPSGQLCTGSTHSKL
jgi:hypothetical protein